MLQGILMLATVTFVAGIFVIYLRISENRTEKKSNNIKIKDKREKYKVER